MDVTNNVGSETWGAYGVCNVTAVPGKNAVIAGVSERGLWLSTDRGATWKHLGEGDADQIDNRPGMILFDPKTTDTFWEVGCYGKGLFKTTDGGTTFKRLGGDLKHTDCVAVDFKDPERKTVIVGMHEKIRSLMKSTDGGETFENIGANMPEDSNFDDEVVLIDKNTYVTNAAGWWPNTSDKKFAWGIFRTDDGGKTWTKTSDAGPGTHPMIAMIGSIYWGPTWGRGVVQSTDKGNSDKAQYAGEELPARSRRRKARRLTDKQLYMSADAGRPGPSSATPFRGIPTASLSAKRAMPVRVAAYGEKGTAGDRAV